MLCGMNSQVAACIYKAITDRASILFPMTLVKKSSLKSTRGRKSRNVSKLDFTGREPVLVLDNSLKQRVTKKSVDNNQKDRHLFAMLEKQVDNEHELAQEPVVVRHENTAVINNGIGRHEFALMVRLIANMFYVIRTAFNYNCNIFF